jgi:hypothetical protein
VELSQRRGDWFQLVDVLSDASAEITDTVEPLLEREAVLTQDWDDEYALVPERVGRRLGEAMGPARHRGRGRPRTRAPGSPY